jgi:acyl-CoA thioester hydrolase
VYYEDTDAAGVVYYANYLRYLERARTEWLHSLGHSPARIAEAGTAFVVRRVRLDYLKPARLGETIEVTLTVDRLTRASLALGQQVRRLDETLVEAGVELACVDVAAWRPVRIPDALMKTLEELR